MDSPGVARGPQTTALHDRVGYDDIVVLNLLVRKLVDCGVLQTAPAPTGGVAPSIEHAQASA